MFKAEQDLIDLVQLDRKPNPDVLNWAIAESGYSYSEIADHLNIGTSVVGSWSRGEAQPTKGQLTNLAKKIKRPRFVFFLDEVPHELSLDAYHRMSGPSGSSVPLNPFERLAVRRARYLQVLLSDLVATSESPAVELPDLDDMESASAGGELRAWLNQFRIVGSSDANGIGMEFGDWRAILQRAGVFVFALRVQESHGSRTNLRGFALQDEFAPVICVVSKDIPRARTFTLFHEMAHLGRRSTVSCHVPTPNTANLEQWCDRVANHALIDRTALENVIGGARADIDAVERVSRTFKVSMRAAALAMQDFSTANAGLYAQVDSALPWRDIPQKTGRGGGQPRHVFRINELGELTVSTVVEALNQRRIGEAQARRLLRLDGPDIEAAAEVVGVNLTW